MVEVNVVPPGGSMGVDRSESAPARPDPAVAAAPPDGQAPEQPAERRAVIAGIDAMKEMAAGMAEMEEMAGLAIFSTVAHELRGPLMALATSAELLVADFDSLAPEQIREMVAAIHCRALWLQELVENLLCAASLREGRLAIHVQPLNLIEVVAEVRQVVHPLLRRRDQRLRIHDVSPIQLPEVHADGRRLGQVLVNLILNASKFSPPGSPVEVVLGARGLMMRVTVADRGPGLPAGLVEQLFEPFFRAPSSQSAPRTGVAGATAPEGVGLGLAIVKEIVARHGGSVGAANRRGGGSRFWFELPLPTEPEA